MSLPLLLAVGVLGGLGALARFALDAALTVRVRRAFPVGILVVNLLGAFGLGLLVGAGAGGDARRLAGVGFLGAFTTFSTWMLDSHRLAEGGRPRAAVANVAGSLLLGLGAVWLGQRAGRALF